MQEINVFTRFIAFSLLLFFVWMGVAGLVQTAHDSDAKQFYENVVQRLEQSNFSEEMQRKCQGEARQKNYELEIELFVEGENKDARVKMEHSFIVPIIQKKKTEKIEGYAR